MRTFLVLILLVTLAACTKPAAPVPSNSVETPAETGLEHIPEPDAGKIPRMEDLPHWKNPQLVVREDGIGLVDAENHEIHILKLTLNEPISADRFVLAQPEVTQLVHMGGKTSGAQR